MRDTLLVALLPAAVRLLLIGSFPLSEDEAYYWEWSRRLAPGYHDQGPGVALAIRCGTSIFGHTEFGVRFPSVVLLSGALAFAHRLMLEMAGRRAALAGAIALNVVPLFALAGVMMLHESVQAFFWSAALFAFWRANSSGSSVAWWILTGAAVGFAFDGKYTAILFLPAALLFLWTDSEKRAWLRRPHPWLAAATALAAVSPVLFWNHANGWPSVHQVVELGRPRDSLFAPGFAAELLGTQFGVISPILFGLVLFRCWAVGRRFSEASRCERFLFWFTVTYAGPFFVLALHSRVYPNWPGLGWLTGILLVAGWAVGRFGGAERSATPALVRGRLFKVGVGLAAASTTLLYLHLATGVLPIPGHVDPAKRFLGWPEMGRWVRDLRDRTTGAGPPAALYAKSYQVAALLAFYTPGQPEVFEVKHWDRPNQYDYWPDLRRGSDALLVVHREEEVPEITRRSFAQIVPLPDDTLTIERHGGTAQRLRAYFCRTYAPDSATSH